MEMGPGRRAEVTSLGNGDEPRPRRRLDRLLHRSGEHGSMKGSGGPLGTAQDDARILRATRIQLMAVSGAVTFVILLVLSVTIYAMASQLLEQDGATAVRAAAGSAVEILRANPHSAYRPRAFGADSSILTLVLPPNGTVTVLAGPEGDQPTGLPDEASLAVARSGAVDVRDTTLAYQGLPVRIMSELALPDGTVVQVIQDRTLEVRFLASLVSTLEIAGFVGLVLAVLAGYSYSGRALSPVRRSLDLRRSALQRQQEFAANASHELRTPLTVLAASVEDLERNRRQRVEAVGEALTDIRESVRDLTELVEDMLLLARTDSGLVQLERLPLDLGDMAAEAISNLTAMAREHGVGVMLDAMPTPTQGDPQRLLQLVTILVDHAVRQSPPGAAVQVLVRPDGDHAVLEVDDSGPGFRPDDLPSLWQRFWRADNAPPSGSGLGLAIAKWIVDQHRGTIAVLNRPDRGATFLVRLPQA